MPQNRRKTGVKELRGGVDPAVGKATQFKSGESGNPTGRPRRKPITDAYLAFFEANPEELGKLVRAMFQQAKKGNVRAMIEITDRVEGKAPIDVKLDLGEQLVQRLQAGLKRAEGTRESVK